MYSSSLLAGKVRTLGTGCHEGGQPRRSCGNRECRRGSLRGISVHLSCAYHSAFAQRSSEECRDPRNQRSPRLPSIKWPRHKGNISFEPLPSEQVVLVVMLTPMSTERKTPNQCPFLHRLRLRRPPPRTTTILSRFVSYCHRVVLIADRPAYRRWCLHDDGRWASGQGCPRESVRPSRVLRCLEMSVL